MLGSNSTVSATPPRSSNPTTTTTNQLTLTPPSSKANSTYNSNNQHSVARTLDYLGLGLHELTADIITQQQETEMMNSNDSKQLNQQLQQRNRSSSSSSILLSSSVSSVTPAATPLRSYDIFNNSPFASSSNLLHQYSSSSSSSSHLHRHHLSPSISPGGRGRGLTNSFLFGGGGGGAPATADHHLHQLYQQRSQTTTMASSASSAARRRLSQELVSALDTPILLTSSVPTTPILGDAGLNPFYPSSSSCSPAHSLLISPSRIPSALGGGGSVSSPSRFLATFERNAGATTSTTTPATPSPAAALFSSSSISATSLAWGTSATNGEQQVFPLNNQGMMKSPFSSSAHLLSPPPGFSAASLYSSSTISSTPSTSFSFSLLSPPALIAGTNNGTTYKNTTALKASADFIANGRIITDTATTNNDYDFDFGDMHEPVISYVDMSDSGSNEYMSDDEIKYNGEDDEHRHENDDSGCALDKLAVSFDQEEEEDEDEDGQIPTRSLWIGNVDPTLSPADLLALFAPYGRVESLRILPDKECAFVNYTSVESAMTAKTYMQSGRVGACIVRIGYGKVIEPKNPKLLKQHQQQGSTTAPEKQESTSSSNISSQPTKSLWVGNLPYATTPASLEAMFATYGTVESARILTHKNCGFVNFTNAAHAAAAKLAMNGKRAPGSGAADAGVAGVLKIGFAKVPTKADLVSVNRATACMREKNTYYPGKQQQVQHQQSSTTVYPRLIAGAPIIPVFPPTSSVQFDNSSPDRHQYDYDQQYSVPTFAMSTIETALPSPPPPPPPVAAAEHYPALSEVYKSSSSSLTETTTISVSSDRAALRIDTSPITTGTATTATRRSVSSSSALSCDSSSTAVVPYIATTMSSVVDENEDGRVTGDEGGGSACSVDQEDEGKMHEKYASALPPLPEADPDHKIEQSRLKEIRKKLEGHTSARELENFYIECLEHTVDLSTDFVGNVILQKLIDKCNDHHRLKIIEKLAPHMAAIGVHKNGTWVVQKVIDTARTTTQIHQIVNAVKHFTPPLLLDSFGNYVVQCCLRLGTHRNQFIFDAMHDECLKIALGRFGARSMRTCLESQYTTKRQQKHVAIALVQNVVKLATHANGSLLMSWLLDTSTLPGRFRVLAPKVAPHVVEFATHKLASPVLLKIVSQQEELDARDMMLKEIFYKSDTVLETILAHQSQGVGLVQKILTCSAIPSDEKIGIADRVRLAMQRMPEFKEGSSVNKKLLEELKNIPKGDCFATASSLQQDEDNVSPLTSQVGFFQDSLPVLANTGGGYSLKRR